LCSCHISMIAEPAYAIWIPANISSSHPSWHGGGIGIAAASVLILANFCDNDTLVFPSIVNAKACLANHKQTTASCDGAVELPAVQLPTRFEQER
jgi:hypothetical protein